MVATGLEVLCVEQAASFRGRRVGVLCHPASVAADLTHAVDRLIQAGIRPLRLFGPEHGVRGEAQDMIGVDDDRDARTGIPVASLYGSSFESLTPRPEDLAALDVLLVDLQDVGSRYYTYVWTMALVMGAAAQVGVQVVVLDRPNPIGGRDIEGGPLLPGHESFVGLGPVAVRHGLTVGELAAMIRAGMPWAPGRFARPLDVELTVIPMRGWRRADAFDSTGLPWVMPSPNMPTLETAFVYPGLCLIEGTNLSEGRGTTRPFEIVGAPFLDGHRWVEALRAEGLPGVLFRPLTFRPMFHKFAGQSCGGVQLHVADRAAFRPYRTGVALLRTARALAPDQFRWRTEPYEFVTHPPAIDLLTGSDLVRRAVDEGRPTAEIADAWSPFEAAFAASRAPFLLYE